MNFQMKLAILEQKLLKEEQERKLMQEKADEVSPRPRNYVRTCWISDVTFTFLLIHLLHKYWSIFCVF